jgi:uncharacterized protein CbrC (UPF0167 family)
VVSSLPVFRYHPDPVSTGYVEQSAKECRCCERARGAVYVGPVYGVDGLDEHLCPWCVAEGRAARSFGAEFVDTGAGVPRGIPAEVLDELATRTIGFAAWQPERWLYHCGDGAAFLGLASDDPGELQSLASVSATYRFRCLHCGAELSYTDSP